MKALLPLLLLCWTAAAQVTDIQAGRIRAQVKFLASDLLEGRGVGERGGDLATEYIATQLALMGVKPAGDNGTFFQRVPLVGVTTEPTATLRIANRPADWFGARGHRLQGRGRGGSGYPHCP